VSRRASPPTKPFGALVGAPRAIWVVWKLINFSMLRPDKRRQQPLSGASDERRPRSPNSTIENPVFLGGLARLHLASVPREGDKFVKSFASRLEGIGSANGCAEAGYTITPAPNDMLLGALVITPPRFRSAAPRPQITRAIIDCFRQIRIARC